jgi:hypothetical protein
MQVERLPVMTGGLGDCQCALWPLAYRSAWAAAVRIATPIGRTLIALHAKEAFALDAHCHLEIAREDSCVPFRAVFDQLFQHSVDRCIVAFVHFCRFIGVW